MLRVEITKNLQQKVSWFVSKYSNLYQSIPICIEVGESQKRIKNMKGSKFVEHFSVETIRNT